MAIRIINKRYGNGWVLLDSLEEAERVLALRGYTLPEDGLVEGRDFEIDDLRGRTATDAWGNTVKLHPTIIEAKEEFIKERGKQDDVSLLVAVEDGSFYFYAVLPEWRGVNCKWEDIDRVDDWFEPEWIKTAF
jgi:hypothetical protein